MQILGRKIASIRLGKGKTQLQVSSEMGFNNSYQNGLELGYRSVGTYYINNFSELYGKNKKEVEQFKFELTNCYLMDTVNKSFPKLISKLEQINDNCFAQDTELAVKLKRFDKLKNEIEKTILKVIEG